jgi:enhancing lycopene biosynthesis protein 2
MNANTSLMGEVTQQNAVLVEEALISLGLIPRRLQRGSLVNFTILVITGKINAAKLFKQ